MAAQKIKTSMLASTLLIFCYLLSISICKFVRLSQQRRTSMQMESLTVIYILLVASFVLFWPFMLVAMWGLWRADAHDHMPVQILPTIAPSPEPINNYVLLVPERISGG
jgi:hypothetical protein